MYTQVIELSIFWYVFNKNQKFPNALKNTRMAFIESCTMTYKGPTQHTLKKHMAPLHDDLV